MSELRVCLQVGGGEGAGADCQELIAKMVKKVKRVLRFAEDYKERVNQATSRHRSKHRGGSRQHLSGSLRVAGYGVLSNSDQNRPCLSRETTSSAATGYGV